eukprot:Lankesteria_metandrocarpae@DN2568_c0_g1_i1.p1
MYVVYILYRSMYVNMICIYISLWLTRIVSFRTRLSQLVHTHTHSDKTFEERTITSQHRSSNNHTTASIITPLRRSTNTSQNRSSNNRTTASIIT